jgi:hypothetical protein
VPPDASVTVPKSVPYSTCALKGEKFANAAINSDAVIKIFMRSAT